MADPQEEREQLKAIEASYADKDYARALALGETLLTVFPASFNGRLLYARTLKALNRQEELENILAEMHGRYPENTLVLQELADLFLKQGRYRQAAEQYRQISFLEPFNRHARDLADKLDKNGQEAEQAPDRFEDTSVEIKISHTVTEDERLASTVPEISLDDDLAAALAARASTEPEPVAVESFQSEFGLPLAAVSNLKVETTRTEEELRLALESPEQVSKVAPDTTEFEQAAADIDLFEQLAPESAFDPPEPAAGGLEIASTRAESAAAAVEFTDIESDSGTQPQTEEESAAGAEAVFETESQAELFLSQGLVREAAYIYLRLHAKSGQERFLELHRKLLADPVDRDQARRKVAALQNLLKAFQKRGKQLVQ